MKKSLCLLTTGLLLLGITACSSLQSRAKKLTLGMERQQVVKTLGGSYTPVAARTEEGGSNIEVLRFGKRKRDSIYTYFRDGKLVQWGDESALDRMPPGSN